MLGQDRTKKRKESCCGRSLASDRISAKTLDHARGTDRAYSKGPPRRRVYYQIAKYPLPGTYRGAIHVYRNLQLLGVVCKASQFQAQLTLREETNNDHFFATEGRAAKKLGQGKKLSQ
jgi:hypothetical protein